MAEEEKEGAESLQIRLSNLNICIEKVAAKCWLAEIWQLSQWGAIGELEEQFKFQKHSCKLSFLFLPRRESASESLLAGYSNLVCSFFTGAVTEHASLTQKRCMTRQITATWETISPWNDQDALGSSSPPKSAIAFLMMQFLEISFKIFKAPIWKVKRKVTISVHFHLLQLQVKIANCWSSSFG